MVVDEADALFAGLGRDEHDDAQVVAVGDGLDGLQIVGKGEVGDDHARHTGIGTRLAERLDAIVQDGVQIAHQDEWDVHLVLDGLELLQQQAHRHAVAECLGGGGLDDGTVGQRVAEGDADLNEVDATALHGQDDVGRAVEGWTASTEVEGEEFLSLWPFGE